MAHPVIYIADISKWQRLVNWATFLLAGGQGAILRSTFGPFQDVCVHDFWSSGRKAEIPLGLYLFYLSGYDLNDHLKAGLYPFLEPNHGALEFPGELSLWIDCEEYTRPSSMSRTTCTRRLEELCERIWDACGIYPGIYTRAYWWAENMVCSDALAINQSKLWTAHYTEDPETPPYVADQWYSSRYWLYQYTKKGPGLKFGVMSKEIDLDAFYGSVAEYEAWIGRKIPSEIPEPTIPSAVKVTVNGLAIRTAPVILDVTLVKRVNTGTILYPIGTQLDADGRIWWHLNDGYYVASWFTVPV